MPSALAERTPDFAKVANKYLQKLLSHGLVRTLQSLIL